VAQPFGGGLDFVFVHPGRRTARMSSSSSARQRVRRLSRTFDDVARSNAESFIAVSADHAALTTLGLTPNLASRGLTRQTQFPVDPGLRVTPCRTIVIRCMLFAITRIMCVSTVLSNRPINLRKSARSAGARPFNE